MGEIKHTPGPWRVEAGTTLIWGNCNPDDRSTRGMGYPIAEARINPSGNWSTGPYADEGEANARLIAAAPEMKEALAAYDEYMGRWYDGPESPALHPDAAANWKRVRRALAKADGEAGQ